MRRARARLQRARPRTPVAHPPHPCPATASARADELLACVSDLYKVMADVELERRRDAATEEDDGGEAADPR